uniref:Isoprenylcysteine carboxyl methyltransferase n=1 Tax=Phaselicystis flava TaxID=525924 RepID=A0A3S7V054_9BACT|nr:hypothetical protein [Phaselicystis flava]
MVTAAWLALVIAVALQRLFELRLSRRNEAALRARGGVEHAKGQMPVMIAVHTGWLLAAPLEVLLLDRPFAQALGLAALLVFCAGQALRWSAIRALGGRWTVKVITLPGAPPVTGGVFCFLRHPNYLGVILEIAALPLVHGAWLTAIVFSALNGLLLRQRIRAEERALAAASDYDGRFRGRARFWPRLGDEGTL